MTDFGKGRPFSIRDADQEARCSWDLLEYAHLCTACIASAATIEFSHVYAVVNLDIEEAELKKKAANGGKVAEIVGNVLAGASLLGNRQHLQTTVLFTQSTRLCRLVDSFEWYLRGIVRVMIEQNPRLMQSRKQANSPEFTVGLDLVLQHYDSTFDDFKGALVDRYLDSLLAGPAYLKAIQFIEGKLNRTGQIIPVEQLKYLKALFAVRNSITHENGKLDEQAMSVLFTAEELKDGRNPFPSERLLLISERLCGYGFALESALPDALKREVKLPMYVMVVAGTLRQAWQVSALLVNRDQHA